MIRELQFYVGNEVATANINDLSDAGMRVLQLIDLQKGIQTDMESENYASLKRIVHYAEFFIKPGKDEFRGSQSIEFVQKAKTILEAENALVGKLSSLLSNLYFQNILANQQRMKNLQRRY